MTAATDARRHLEAMVTRQLSIAWSAGVTAGQQRGTRDPLDLAARAAARASVISGCASAVLADADAWGRARRDAATEPPRVVPGGIVHELDTARPA